MATSSRSLVEGPLSKWTNVVSGWQYRWFVLDDSSGLLSYYTSKDKMSRGSRRGCIKLKKAMIGIDDEDVCTFNIQSGGQVYHFQAQDAEERERWVQALDLTIRRLKQPVQRLELEAPKNKQGLTIDQRLAICESYYTLLTQQSQNLSESMNTSHDADTIRNTTQNMLSALRKCIDLMKEDQLLEVADPTVPLTSPDMQLPIESKESSNESLVEEEEVKEDIRTSPTDEDSDNSDDFFDAEDEPQAPMVTSPSVSVPIAEGDPSDVEEENDYDEEDDTGSGVAAHKSMIMYMLGQVRVGMDLSRVTLPTFILEKRSLLEMYADFLAHPDLLVNITDYPTPKERMVAFVRYYLSAFHAARKGTIAKKPYNPILGETFQCYWDLPNGQRTPPDQKSRDILESGPVSYASYDSVTFIAEQVSHHPPISGFYAECPTKRVYGYGSIYTKSKFLGLSLAVYNIGKVKMVLMDHDEEYECTLPSAYARSIMTIPWMEIGGKTTISCPKTGFSANLEFHCKPFYGGKKHRVTAEIYEPSERKPFLKVDGEWNGTMYCKHPNGDEEVFLDIFSIPTIRKKFKCVAKQDPGESKRRWIKVTEALARKDELAATDAKHELEEKQRADARERAELGVEWEQKHFHSNGDMWVYNTPLPQRLATTDQPLELEK